MVAGIFHSWLSAIFFMVPRRILPEAGLGQTRHHHHFFERRHRSNLFTHQCDRLSCNLFMGFINTDIEHHHTHRQFAFKLVGSAVEPATLGEYQGER